MGKRSGDSKTKTHIQSKRPTNERVFKTSDVLPKEQWVKTTHLAPQPRILHRKDDPREDVTLKPSRPCVQEGKKAVGNRLPSSRAYAQSLTPHVPAQR